MADLIARAMSKKNETSLTQRAKEKQQSGITNSIQKMVNGASTGICFGDSLTYGYQWHDNGNPSPNIQVANPYPKVLQDLLNKTFKTSGITLINKGKSGRQTTQALADLQTDVLSLYPDFVIILFGTNDIGYAFDVNIFQSNIESMVKQCLHAGIEVVLVSPPPVVNTNNIRTMVFVKAMKEVANVYGLPYIDLHEEVMKMYANKVESPKGLFPDLMHFEDNKYHYIADVIMNHVFDYNFSNLYHIGDKAEIPIVSNPYIETDCTGVVTNQLPFFRDTTYLSIPEPLTGSYLRFSFYVDKTGMDLVLKSLKTTNGGKLGVVVDGVITKTIDFYSVASYGFEEEDTIIENMSFGYHTVEFLSTNLTIGQAAIGGYAYFTSFLFRKTKVKTNLPYNALSQAYLLKYELFEKVLNGKFRSSQTVNDNQDGILLTSCNSVELKESKTLVIEVEGLLKKLAGFTWFGNIADNSTNTLSNKTDAGYFFIFSNNTSTAILANIASNNQLNILATSSNFTIDFNLKHKIRIEHTYQGVITIFLDGVQILQFTDTKNRTGYFGVFDEGTGVMEIDRFEYCYI